MKVLALLILLAASGRLGAQSAPHTPVAGTAERRAILDALRTEMRRTDPRPVIFVVRHLRVQGGWAWLRVEPQSPDGREHYEGESALLRRVAGRWSVSERMPAAGEREGTPAETECGYFRALRARFPAAPPRIFPAAGCGAG
jgi:hypothetical protein